MQPRVVGLF